APSPLGRLPPHPRPHRDLEERRASAASPRSLRARGGRLAAHPAQPLRAFSAGPPPGSVRRMARIHNFNAGPAALPLPVLERAQREMLDYAGSGMSIMEHSHRGKVYEAVHADAIARLKRLLDLGD